MTRAAAGLRAAIEAAGHEVAGWEIAREDEATLRGAIERAMVADVVLVTGGTGVSPRDRTPDVITDICDRMIPGFGELFRGLSYEEIGSKALSSRACAGVRGSTLIFALPGSTAACRLGWEQLIRPEVLHLRSMQRGEGHESTNTEE